MDLFVYTLGKEERKAYLQQASCCLLRMVHAASKELGVDPKVVLWSWPDEIDRVAAEPEIAEERAKASILIVNKDSEVPPQRSYRQLSSVALGVTLSVDLFVYVSARQQGRA